MENNFEKHIRETMNDPPEFPFEERLWKEMETRLKEEKEDPPKSGFIYWVPLLLFSVVASAFAGVFFLKHNEAMNKIASLEEQMNLRNEIQLESPSSNHQQIHQQYVIIDTIYKNELIVRYDTIYQSFVLEGAQGEGNRESANRFGKTIPFGERRLLFPPQRNAFSGFLSSENAKDSPSNLLFSDKGFNQSIFNWNKNIGLSESLISDNGINNNTITNFNNDENGLTLTTPLDFLPMLPSSFLTIDDEIKPPLLGYYGTKKKKKKRQADFYLLKLKPSSIALSAVVGQSTSLNLKGGKKGKSTLGVHAEIGYGQRFNFVVGVENIDNIYEFEYENIEKDIEGYPNLPPNNPGDVLHKIYGDFEYIQIPFGIKYSVSPRGDFHPYFGLGLISKKARVSTLRFEYLSIMEEYYVDETNLLSNSFEINDFYTTIGLNYDLTRKLSLLVEGSSQFRFKPGEYNYEKTQLLKWNGGLRYQF